MFGKKKTQTAVPSEQPKEKPVPAYLREDYPYQAVGEPITDWDSLEQHGVLYEIKCPQCGMSIRSQGCNIKETYERMINEKGCIGCGNKDLSVRRVDTSVMPQTGADKAE